MRLSNSLAPYQNNKKSDRAALKQEKIYYLFLDLPSCAVQTRSTKRQRGTSTKRKSPKQSSEKKKTLMRERERTLTTQYASLLFFFLVSCAIKTDSSGFVRGENTPSTRRFEDGHAIQGKRARGDTERTALTPNSNAVGSTDTHPHPRNGEAKTATSTQSDLREVKRREQQQREQLTTRSHARIITQQAKEQGQRTKEQKKKEKKKTSSLT